MNILIRFEDRFGCYTLFSKSNSILNKSTHTEIHEGLSNVGVFKITPKMNIEDNDYIIFVFDLDPIKGSCITSEYLMSQLEGWLLENNSIKKELKGKIILIPVYFCYESLYLYSDIFQNKISECNKRSETIDKRLINIYKNYYDYSERNPESLYGLTNQISKIKENVDKIKETSKEEWKTQKFHQAYSEQILRSLFNKTSYNTKIRKLFTKKEDRLFSEIDRFETAYTSQQLIDSIINGMGKESIHNRKFYEFLTVQDINKLKDWVITEESLKDLCKEIDGYKVSIDGIKRDICDLADMQMIWSREIYKKLGEK